MFFLRSEPRFAVDVVTVDDSSKADEASVSGKMPDDKSFVAKPSVRDSLKASTLDGIFAAVFSNTTSGVLLTSFLLELGAQPFEIGLLAAIPLLANLLQPIGAHWSEQTHSRHWFCAWIYAPARSLWLLLIIGIFLLGQGKIEPQVLMWGTMAIALLSSGYGALGSAPWLSWMAQIVPCRLRGRYFGFRNSAANLTNLISIPLLGLGIGHWMGGAIEGYGIALGLGMVAGMVSLGFQGWMVDVDPQERRALQEKEEDTMGEASRNGNFLRFLLYYGTWMFAVNLSAPFFNLYLLDNLHLDLAQVTLYNSLMAAANLLMLMLWGRLADRVGNRPILLGVGMAMAWVPLLWWGVNGGEWSVWLGIPLLHLLMGGTGAAIDLCGNNVQMSVAPQQNQSTYFGVVAAIAGVSGAIGTMAGGFLAESVGLLGLFGLSTVVRLAALLPLIFVAEERSQSLRQMLRHVLPQES
jgi:MFS family permease